MNQKEELIELTKLKSIIISSFGFDTQYLAKSEVIPLDMILSIVPANSQQKVKNLVFTFIPFGENGMSEINLLQFYSILPNIELKSQPEDLKNLILYMNHRTPFGNFSFTDNNEIAFRYIYVVSKKNGINTKEFPDVLSLFLYSLDMFGSKIEALINNKATFEELKKELLTI
jgi:hypothetical protein